MSISSVGYSPVNCQTPKKATTNQNVSFAGAEAQEPSKGKKVAKGFASFLLTGLGQVCDGRVKDGLKDFGVATGLLVGSSVIAKLGSQNLIKTVEAAAKNPAIKSTPYGWYASVAACGLLGIAFLANKIHSIVDAYKGGK